MLKGRSLGIWGRLLSSKRNYLVIIILTVLVLFAFIGSFFLKDSSQVDLFNTFKEPFDSGFLLGSDQLGRDVFSGLINGLRIALLIGVLSSLISLITSILIVDHVYKCNDILDFTNSFKIKNALIFILFFKIETN